MGTYLLDINIRRASNNADLTSLEVTPGALLLAFKTDVTAYSINVGHVISNIAISATPADENANVEGTGDYSLNVGSNTFTVTVIAQDGIANKKYTIMIIRAAPSKNADLGSLTVDPGILEPSFSPNITNYTVIVDNIVTAITVIGEPDDVEADVSGNTYRSLNVGNNTLTIKVTSPDGTTAKTYTVLVIREQLTGVEDEHEELLKAFPNPARDKITISGLQGSGILTVFDVAGRQLIKQNIANPQETVSVSNLPQGSYIVRVVEGKNMRMIKIIVE
jgi:hypothetical protein